MSRLENTPGLEVVRRAVNAWLAARERKDWPVADFIRAKLFSEDWDRFTALFYPPRPGSLPLDVEIAR